MVLLPLLLLQLLQLLLWQQLLLWLLLAIGGQSQRPHSTMRQMKKAQPLVLRSVRMLEQLCEMLALALMLGLPLTMFGLQPVQEPKRFADDAVAVVVAGSEPERAILVMSVQRLAWRLLQRELSIALQSQQRQLTWKTPRMVAALVWVGRRYS